MKFQKYVFINRKLKKIYPILMSKYSKTKVES